MNNSTAIELGLSVRWAACNLGASTPEGFGDYFAWGETETKVIYGWRTYKWNYSSIEFHSKLSKYNNISAFGLVDYKTLLEEEDDIAHIRLGGKWRMPTFAECKELRDNCTWIWTKLNYVEGCLLTSNLNGESIFFPATGLRDEKKTIIPALGRYWSSSVLGNNTYDACSLEIGPLGVKLGWDS